MSRQSKASQIMDALREDGAKTNEVLAERFQCSANYIGIIRRRLRAETVAMTPVRPAMDVFATKQERQEHFLKNLLLTHGVVTDAAHLTGVDVTRPYTWMREEPEFKARVEEVKEMAIDFVESHLFQQIRDNNPASTIFFLKTRAKHRGYVERTEVTGNDGRPLEIRVILPSEQYIEPDPERDILVTATEQ